MKRFERSNGLDTALYKNYLYLFFNIPCEPLEVGLDNVICMELYSNALENRYNVHPQIRYRRDRTHKCVYYRPHIATSFGLDAW